jgi:chitin synthase
MSSSREAMSLIDLTQLVNTTSATTVYPTEDTVLSVLQSRFRADLPYTRLGESSYVVVNPVKSLASANDASAREYEEKCFRETNGTSGGLQPHLYDLAARIYLVMQRRNESQAIIFR